MPTTDYIMTSLYFEKLTQALRQAGVCTPALIIDKERFDKNIDLLTNTLSKGFDYRIVAKSLPSIPMLQYIMRRAGTVRLMSFHLPFLMQVIKQIPSADILMVNPCQYALRGISMLGTANRTAACALPQNYNYSG